MSFPDWCDLRGGVAREKGPEENLKLTELCEKASVTIQTLVKEHELFKRDNQVGKSGMLAGI